MYSTSHSTLASMTDEAAPDAASAGLGIAALKETVRSHYDEIQACYADAADQAPKLRGKVLVRIGIHADGRVRAAAAVENTTGLDEVGCCIADQMLSWSFPPATGTKSVLFELPFHPRAVEP
jgi:hypothetical protein